MENQISTAYKILTIQKGEAEKAIKMIDDYQKLKFTNDEEKKGHILLARNLLKNAKNKCSFAYKEMWKLLKKEPELIVGYEELKPENET